jgi:hypothetical protein
MQSFLPMSVRLLASLARQIRQHSDPMCSRRTASDDLLTRVGKEPAADLSAVCKSVKPQQAVFVAAQCPPTPFNGRILIDSSPNLGGPRVNQDDGRCPIGPVLEGDKASLYCPRYELLEVIFAGLGRYISALWRIDLFREVEALLQDSDRRLWIWHFERDWLVLDQRRRDVTFLENLCQVWIQQHNAPGLDTGDHRVWEPIDLNSDLSPNAGLWHEEVDQNHRRVLSGFVHSSPPARHNVKNLSSPLPRDDIAQPWNRVDVQSDRHAVRRMRYLV